MMQALNDAERNRIWPRPNPSVGCVLTSPQGYLLGQGHTQEAGGPHAEIMALRDAHARGMSVIEATAHVTLEPCSHFGRTGPCCDALITAGIKKVVATNCDPNPLVSGRGFARLRAAGVEVEILAADDPLAIQSREINIGFFSRMIRKIPWVRMKIAASLDGKTALNCGDSKWITSLAARTDGHVWRARSCAVLTGIGTVLADNPLLDVRLVQAPHQPKLIIIDSSLQTPVDAAIFMNERTVWIYTATQNEQRRQKLEDRGATVFYMPGKAADDTPNGKVDLRAVLLDLGLREINELHIEAGARLNGALISEGLVDELLVYLAPKLLGQGRDMTNVGPLSDLTQALQLDFLSSAIVGPDLRLLARVKGRDDF